MPKTYNNLFNKFISWENILLAVKNASKGKNNKREVILYLNHLEDNLILLRDELISNKYLSEPCSCFEKISGNKRRQIEAPSFKDRIVHHAIVQIIEPLFEKKFIYHSYSCRKNKGTHKSADTLEQFIRIHKRNNKNTYILKCDISKFFSSINHQILWKIFKKTVKDKKFINIIQKSTISSNNKSNKGIPIGALTSQLFANIYLNELDHYIKEDLKIHFYIRYADDFILIDNNKQSLNYYLYLIKKFIEQKLDLKLNPKTTLFLLKQGVDFCGYRIWSTHRLPRKRIIKTFKKKLFKQIKYYKLNNQNFNNKYLKNMIASYRGYFIKCNSYRTIKEISNKINNMLKKVD